MSGSFKDRALAVLRVSPQPHVPPGEERSAQVFHAAPMYFRYLLLSWGVKHIFAWAGFFAGLWFMEHWLTGRIGRGLDKFHVDIPGGLHAWLLGLEAIGAVVLTFQTVGSLLLVRWDYQCRWYILTDRCLRIQEGIWTFREQTYTLANLQNIDLRQNPLQRLFGISDVVVHTAGGGAPRPEEGERENLHIGRLRGVAGGEAIRDHLLQRMKAFRDAGLGDTPAMPARAAAGANVPEAGGHACLRSATARLLEEIRALRAELEAPQRS